MNARRRLGGLAHAKPRSGRALPSAGRRLQVVLLAAGLCGLTHLATGSELPDVIPPWLSQVAPGGSAVPVAVSVGRLSDGSRIYQAVTNVQDWSGEIRVLRLSQGLGTGPCPDQPQGSVCDDPRSPYQTTRAEGAFPAWDRRRLFTLADGRPVRFDSTSLWGGLSTAQQQALMGCVPVGVVDSDDCQAPGDLPATNPLRELAEDRVDWLRGRADPGGELRSRATLLGDMLRSAPVVVGPPRQLFQSPDYQAFQRSPAQDRKTMVYVGANDGMLHAFNADSPAGRLEEVFAYVPQAVYRNLAALPEPTYGGAGATANKAFVDGPISYSDARLGAAGGASDWRSVLVGSFGMGAQGVYALDVTDPDALRAEDVVLWEFTDASGADADGGALDGRDMGYSLSQPAIVRIGNEPVWTALIGNGYGNTEVRADEDPDACRQLGGDAGNCTVSQSGNAVLYVLAIGAAEVDRVYARMDTGAGVDQDPARLGRANGLSEVSTLDEDGDLIADRAYAGDLFGHLWRFDLADTKQPPQLMFRARDDQGNPQPITTRVVFTRHPNGGYMLLFGTGKLVNAQDTQDVGMQSFYGIWDDGGAVHGNTVPTRGDNLLEHAFVGVAEVTNSSGTRVSRARISTAEPRSKPTGPVRGWYIDLALSTDPDTSGGCEGSERVVVNPQVREGRVVFVSTIPVGGCGAGGASWINALDAINGSRPAATPFDFNRDGNVDAHDLLTVVTQEGTSEQQVGSSAQLLADTGASIHSAPVLLEPGGGEAMNVFSDTAGDLIQLEEPKAHGWRTWLQIE